MESQGFVVGGWNKVEGANVWRRLVIGPSWAWLGVYEACDGNGKPMPDAFVACFCVSDDPRGRKSIGGTYTNPQLAMSTADLWWSKFGIIEAAPKSLAEIAKLFGVAEGDVPHSTVTEATSIAHDAKVSGLFDIMIAGNSGRTVAERIDDAAAWLSKYADRIDPTALARALVAIELHRVMLKRHQVELALRGCNNLLPVIFASCSHDGCEMERRAVAANAALRALMESMKAADGPPSDSCPRSG